MADHETSDTYGDIFVDVTPRREPRYSYIPIDDTLPDPLPPFHIPPYRDSAIFRAIKSVYPNTSALMVLHDEIILQYEDARDAPATLPPQLGGNKLVGAVGPVVANGLTQRVARVKGFKTAEAAVAAAVAAAAAATGDDGENANITGQILNIASRRN